jgi:hypothetical protein
MKTLAELQAFYESDLLPDLQEMESLRLKKRKQIRILEYIMKPLIFAPAGLLVIGTMTGEDIFDAILFQFFYMIFIFIAFVFIRTRLSNSYNPPEFKTRIMDRIVQFIDDELTYEPKNCIAWDDFLNSGIFYYDKNTFYNGDDLVKGSIGRTSFAFSEIITYGLIQDPKGRDADTVYSIFHGLFFIADFNKKFKGKTFVFPRKRKRKRERLRGKHFRFFFPFFPDWIHVIFYRMKKNYGELVRLEDPRFEKSFVVYGSDQIEARYILSTALMRRICDYREKTKKNIYISFVDNRVHVGIYYGHNLFETDVYTSLDFGLIREYYEDMAHVIGIVEDLHLNTRIWN